MFLKTFVKFELGCQLPPPLPSANSTWDKISGILRDRVKLAFSSTHSTPLPNARTMADFIY